MSRDYSFCSHLDPVHSIAEIRLFLGDPKSKDRVFVVVEGIHDINFFKKLLSSQVYLIQSFNFNSNSKRKSVIDIVKTFSYDKRVIGIVDRDYHSIKELSSIFWYDYCNVEMMIIQFDDIMYEITNDYFRGTESFSLLRNKIFDYLKKPSFIRWKNHVNQLNLKMREIYSQDFYDSNINTAEQKYIECVKKNQGSSFLFNLSHDAVFNGSFTSENLFDYCNGHDFVDMFVFISKESGNKYCNHINVQRSMKNAFSKLDHFVRTILYSELRQYGINNQLSLLEY